MSLQAIAAAVARVKAAFTRRPEAGVHDDGPATARWVSASRVVVRNPDGLEVITDMPVELGGSGGQFTPGWLMRAGMASCAATSITLACASQGVALTALQVDVASRSDARGLLGMAGADGATVYAGPFDVVLRVSLSAAGATPEDLQALVQKCLGHSPVPCAMATATPFDLQVRIMDAAL
ncbi:osmotically inducible protein OsmC [Rhodoferax lacus]|uniref:Osmotically inducible protein OsmC n=1 Tax=Rhodoferax lacus TaxID=2184758 RepID=A0A3E1RDI1_9BURK|nr:OsmC family protein [Rhodoferax lacus]RFO97428.1 osmotically inducible protein OsmC [Rhodoferax lacus]